MSHRRHSFKLSLVAVMLGTLLLTGCGKKGSLYLPDNPPTPAHKQPKS